MEDAVEQLFHCMAHLHWTVAGIGLKLDGVRVSGRRWPRMGRRRRGAPLMGD